MGRRLRGADRRELWVEATLLVALAALGSVAGASAMGDPPSTCRNRYDGRIVSFTVTNGTQTFDPLARPGLTFEASVKGSYNVTFVIRTRDRSSQGNTRPGTTWYQENAFGYALGTCYPGRVGRTVGPDMNVSIAGSYDDGFGYPPGFVQFVFFQTASELPSGGVNFSVDWVAPAAATTTTTTATSSTTSGGASSTATGATTTLTTSTTGSGPTAASSSTTRTPPSGTATTTVAPTASATTGTASSSTTSVSSGAQLQAGIALGAGGALLAVVTASFLLVGRRRPHI